MDIIERQRATIENLSAQLEAAKKWEAKYNACKASKARAVQEARLACRKEIRALRQEVDRLSRRNARLAIRMAVLFDRLARGRECERELLAQHIARVLIAWCSFTSRR